MCRGRCGMSNLREGWKPKGGDTQFISSLFLRCRDFTCLFACPANFPVLRGKRRESRHVGIDGMTRSLPF